MQTPNLNKKINFLLKNSKNHKSSTKHLKNSAFKRNEGTFQNSVFKTFLTKFNFMFMSEKVESWFSKVGKYISEQKTKSSFKKIGKSNFISELQSELRKFRKSYFEFNLGSGFLKIGKIDIKPVLELHFF